MSVLRPTRPELCQGPPWDIYDPSTAVGSRSSLPRSDLLFRGHEYLGSLWGRNKRDLCRAQTTGGSESTQDISKDLNCLRRSTRIILTGSLLTGLWPSFSSRSHRWFGPSRTLRTLPCGGLKGEPTEVVSKVFVFRNIMTPIKITKLGPVTTMTTTKYMWGDQLCLVPRSQCRCVGP